MSDHLSHSCQRREGFLQTASVHIPARTKSAQIFRLTDNRIVIAAITDPEFWLLCIAVVSLSINVVFFFLMAWTDWPKRMRVPSVTVLKECAGCGEMFKDWGSQGHEFCVDCIDTAEIQETERQIEEDDKG